MNDMDRLSRAIEHTLLVPTATDAEIVILCEEALKQRFVGVCVHSSYVRACRERLDGLAKCITVVGFPHGASSTEAKVSETLQAVKAGADEIDMVIALGPLLSGNIARVREDIASVVEAARPSLVKVIIETGYLDDGQKKLAGQLCEQAGAQFVKTCTGYGPGKAEVRDIELLRGVLSQSIQIKASAGIRTRAQALALLNAGADRLGTSAGLSIVLDGP